MFELWISFPYYEAEPALYAGAFESAQDALDYAACHFWDGIPWVENFLGPNVHMRCSALDYLALKSQIGRISEIF